MRGLEGVQSAARLLRLEHPPAELRPAALARLLHSSVFPGHLLPQILK